MQQDALNALATYTKARGQVLAWLGVMDKAMPTLTAFVAEHPDPAPVPAPTPVPVPVPSPVPTPTPPAPALITRQGSAVMLNGHQYRFVGWNVGGAFQGCNGANSFPSAAQQAWFAAQNPWSIPRVWCYAGPGLSEARRIVSAAKAAGRRIVVTLADAHGDCGGSDTSDGWYQAMGQAFAGDPTVAWWEVINESGDAELITRKARVLKAADPTHLVGSGCSAAYGNIANWTACHADPAIDVCSMHEYDEQASASFWFGEVLAAAQKLGKPVHIGEVGITASPNGDPNVHSSNGAPAVSYAAKVKLLDGKIRDYLRHPEVAGVSVWQAWSQPQPSPSYSTGPDDPTNGYLAGFTIPPTG